MQLRRNITLLILAVGLPLAACDEDGAKQNVDASQVGDAAPGQRVESTNDKAEAENASEEPSRTEASSKNAGTVKETPPLPVNEYFTVDDVKQLGGEDLQSSTLAGQEPSETYNAMRIHPSGRNDYGAAVQMWKLDNPKAAAERVADLRGQYLSTSDPAKDAPVKARSAFVSSRQNLWQYVFNPEDRPYVASVTCQEKFCRDIKVVYEIASKVNNRILTEGDAEKVEEAADAKPEKPAKNEGEDKAEK